MNVATGGAKRRAAKPRPVRAARPRRQAPYDPFAPLTPKQMREQAAAAVNAQIGPVIAQINAQIARQEAQGTGNISALTRALANEYAGYVPAERSIYGEAQGTQRADNAALADRLNAAGANVAGNVGGQLAAIGAPAGQQQQAAGLAQVGQGAGNAGFAAGSSELARLVAEAASAENYGAKLPGIAALSGTQQTGALVRALENARLQQTGDLRAKVPGLTADTLQQLRTQEFNKGVAHQSGILNQTKAQADVAYKQASLAARARGQDITVRGQNIRAKQAGARQQAANAKARRSAQADASKQAVKILNDALKPRTQTVQVPKTDMFGGTVKDAAGKPVMTTKTVRSGRQAGYYQVLHEVEAAISPTLRPYMSEAQIIEFAQRIVNPRYAPGKYGRPGSGGRRSQPAAPGLGKTQRG